MLLAFVNQDKDNAGLYPTDILFENLIVIQTRCLN